MNTRIDHIGICVNDLDRYIKLFKGYGGRVYHDGLAKEYDARCVFIKFKNFDIELITPTDKGTHLDRFLSKRGNALHHIAISGNGTVPGAKPGMRVDFKLQDNILLEFVKYEKESFLHKIGRKLRNIKR